VNPIEILIFFFCRQTSAFGRKYADVNRRAEGISKKKQVFAKRGPPTAQAQAPRPLLFNISWRKKCEAVAHA
jgi:hypothetical protein